VEERQAREPDVARAGADLIQPVRRVDDQVLVAQHRPLRPPGRPRGVHQEGELLIVNHNLQSARRGGCQRLLIRSPRQLLLADRGDRFRVGEDVLDLLGGEAEVDRHRAGAELLNPEEGLDELDAVVHLDRDVLARPDPAGGEGVRDPVGTLVELPVAARLVLEGERRGLRITAGGAGDQLGDEKAPRAIQIEFRAHAVKLSDPPSRPDHTHGDPPKPLQRTYAGARTRA
jgi:hypothetical protein